MLKFALPAILSLPANKKSWIPLDGLINSAGDTPAADLLPAQLPAAAAAKKASSDAFFIVLILATEDIRIVYPNWMALREQQLLSPFCCAISG